MVKHRHRVILSLIAIFLLVGFTIRAKVADSSQCPPPDCGPVPCEHCNPDEPVINAGNSALYREVEIANAAYASTYTPQPDIFSKDKAAVLTCMDSRIMPNEIMGFTAGDMYVIRNAGGRASDDALRSLIISHKLLKTKQWFVVHHTDCGMQKFTHKVMTNLLCGSLVSAERIHNCNEHLFPVENNNTCKWRNTSDCCGREECVDYDYIDWLIIYNGLIDSVIEDVKKIVSHPLVPSDIPVYGFIFDVLTGRLIPVPEATLDGRAVPLVCPDHEWRPLIGRDLSKTGLISL